MVTPHQQTFARIPADRRQRAVFVDTPFGFQENADDLTERILGYFAESVGHQVEHVRLRTAADDPATVARAIASVRSASWVFAGPGSPSYTLRTWRATGLDAALAEVLDHGTMVAASAAALTVGSHTIPVYEIYKVGEEPKWLPGLNLLQRATGLQAAVVPHFDNREGGNHDTRFCYLGERRLRMLEEQLPSGHFILGVDEHTGVRVDQDAQLLTVFGRGGMTVRSAAGSHFVESGGEITVAEIAERIGAVVARVDSAPAPSAPAADAVLQALDAGDVAAAVRGILELDAAGADRTVVHPLVVRVGELAAAPRFDRSAIVGPYVELLLSQRASAREFGRYAEADLLRDALAGLGVTVADGAGGSTWTLAD